MRMWLLVTVSVVALVGAAGCDSEGGDASGALLGVGLDGGVGDAMGDAAGDAAGTDDYGPAGDSWGGGEAADTRAPDAEPAPVETTYASCFPEIVESFGITYDDLGVVTGSHCKGSNHQDITGIEKLVFLGDSITAGVGAPAGQTYPELLMESLAGEFGDIEVVSCAQGGAVNGNLHASQIPQCFPGVEDKRTLVVITSGGNDIVDMAVYKYDAAAGFGRVDQMTSDLRKGLEIFDSAEKFPSGVFVTFANVYEFTDGTGQLDGCPVGALAGLTGMWPDGIEIFSYLEESYAELALEMGRDVIYMMEHFCGHGFTSDDPSTPCYQGDGAQTWFNFDCIHPNPDGHEAIADLFHATITE